MAKLLADTMIAILDKEEYPNYGRLGVTCRRKEQRLPRSMVAGVGMTIKITSENMT